MLYQGDDIGLAQVDVPPDRIRDIDDRDGCRTPLPWTREGGWSEPWLPLGDTVRNVEDQRGDPDSILNFVRETIAMRRSNSDLHSGAYELLEAPNGVWAYRRGADTVVALNLSDERVDFEGRTLQPWEAAVR